MLTCLDCGGALRVVLDMGDMPVVGFPSTTSAPLRLAVCQTCHLVQLAEHVDPAALYQDYWYRSGTNETMVQELADVVASATARVPTVRNVLDIGANDGTLLECYGPDVRRSAVDPNGAFQRELESQGVNVRAGFWPAVAPALAGQTFDVITSIAMWNHVRDRRAFIQAVEAALAPGGVWIVQWQDLAQMIDAVAVDNVVHEHVTYDSVESFRSALRGTGLVVQHVETRRINGGSVRVTVGRGREVYCSQELCDLEAFAAAASAIRGRIHFAVAQAMNQGPIDLYGASTKGCTLLHWAGLDARHIRQALERSPGKIGRTVGATGIPIVSEQAGRSNPAPTWLVPIWQFRDAVIAREHAFLEAGGMMIFPLPHCEIVTGAVSQRVA
jgi:NDP-4-keto-2,6-dideoxyhexose 3-C-methyltransferase